MEDFIRVGEKLISLEKINRLITQMLTLRSRGCSQQEVANRFGVDRSFISRLEKLGAVRKGNRIAVIAFPVKNKGEITRLLKDLGVDYILVMTNEERWRFIEEKSGLELFNEVMQILSDVKSCDIVIVAGSRQRIQWASALLEKDVLGIDLGESPLTCDQYLDPRKLRQLISAVRQDEGSHGLGSPG
ncbi:MAG: Transcriptional regulator [Thermoanaerobacterales bacterium 50_218]|nr:MAG: Transcriptional regulator [Thermoanaerobacterales bacterium 50_218]HAA89140.1 transcriptional regulator [Peptococcaceae bacterium]